MSEEKKSPDERKNGENDDSQGDEQKRPPADPPIPKGPPNT
jgi:hypothetical protein